MLRLAVRVGRERAEIVLAELLELAPNGVEEVDLGDVIEYAVYGPPGELPELPALEAAAAGALVEVTSREVPDDWAERWRRFHRPLVLQDRLTVRPPWEPPGASAVDIVIDPGRAFGTGAHATTRLCLELMLSLPELDDVGGAHVGEAGGRAGASPMGAFLDLGCGSGVLAVAASRLGWAPVIAVDNDPASIDAARANARVNGVELEVRRVDLRTDALPPAGTVAANLLAPLLLACAPRIDRRTGRWLASGLLAHEADGVARAFAAAGLIETDRRLDGDWIALRLEREPRSGEGTSGAM